MGTLNFLRSALCILFFSTIGSSTVSAQQPCETVLECAQLALEEARKSREMVEEMMALRNEITATLNSYNKILAGENIPNLGSKKVITLNLKQPGVLFANVSTANNQGRLGGQRTIQAISAIAINDVQCAIDRSAYYVWSGAANANASCVYYLNAGTHKLVLSHSSTNAATTRSNANYHVIQAKR